MTEPNQNDPRRLEYGATQRTQARRFGAFVSGLVGAWLLMFVPIFLAAASSFEQKRVWWAIPVVLVTALVCSAVAWRTRVWNASFSAGTWAGLAIGALHAGLCFGAL